MTNKADCAIRVEGIGKRYPISSRLAQFGSLRESMSNAARSQAKKMLDLLRGKVDSALDLDDSIWALRDVSFEVGRGEAVGVVGRNGSGKSTLLKIISRITEPTEGWAEINGRVGALLEVGAAFHPELTGRENIYLSGVIRGMKKRDLDRKFDEIVAFSGIGKFIDTAIKRYSSGMVVRLGFSVAVHLQPEILLVDEVLAVGDAEFREQCMEKMKSIIRDSGTTVFLVTHQVQNIYDLCQKTIWLDGGRIVAIGGTEEVLQGLKQAQRNTALDNKKYWGWMYNI
ncbi:MAG TPA: ABC transporter ATP-binding protein [Candidatus Omnitrophota bacterium]|nr:ABC transporter ATP-binding protein [Candidatus Omnitrophota bacterium]